MASSKKDGNKKVTKKAATTPKKVTKKAATTPKKATKKAPVASPCPPTMQWVNVYMSVKKPQTAIAFYEKAFGFKTRDVAKDDKGKIIHAELQYKDCPIMLGPESKQSPTKSPAALGGSTFNFYVYTENVDAFFQQAVDAGATVILPPEDQFWGDRWCLLRDPEGHVWAFATHLPQK